MEKLPLAGIARATKVSESWLQRYVKQKFQQVPRNAGLFTKKTHGDRVRFSITIPFGGYKQSGIGTEKGVRGIQQYMRQKSVYWGMNSTPLPWAGPV